MSKAKTTYQEFDTLPAWTRAVWSETAKDRHGDQKLINEADPLKWSGENDPPAIGATVKIYMNDLGTGRVARYFVEHGWFGVIVELAKPPAWYVKQNKGNPAAHIFGVDLDPRKVQA